jgi:hypothetical protein
LQLSGEVIAAVERGVAAASNESFAAHFQAARREIADDYPSSSRSRGCVEYEGGEARLRRGTDVEKFVAGTSESLRRVVERVAATGERARGVRREVARELAALAERRPRALTRFGFTPQLERIAGCAGREARLSDNDEDEGARREIISCRAPSSFTAGRYLNRDTAPFANLNRTRPRSP